MWLKQNSNKPVVAKCCSLTKRTPFKNPGPITPQQRTFYVRINYNLNKLLLHNVLKKKPPFSAKWTPIRVKEGHLTVCCNARHLFKDCFGGTAQSYP
jgi:hypothetical protein